LRSALVDGVPFGHWVAVATSAVAYPPAPGRRAAQGAMGWLGAGHNGLAAAQLVAFLTEAGPSMLSRSLLASRHERKRPGAVSACAEDLAQRFERRKGRDNAEFAPVARLQNRLRVEARRPVNRPMPVCQF
jgi:hypothetical protein